MMKNIFFCLILCGSFVFSACCLGTDCNWCDIDCGEHGTCNVTDGSCACITGYEINVRGKCDSISRDKFLGTYNVSDICAGGQFAYTVDITINNNDINKVTIHQLGQAGTLQLEVLATIENNRIHIAQQDILFNNHAFRISATTATLIGNTFSLPYTIAIDGGNPETCTGIFTKT